MAKKSEVKKQETPKPEKPEKQFTLIQAVIKLNISMSKYKFYQPQNENRKLTLKEWLEILK